MVQLFKEQKETETDKIKSIKKQVEIDRNMCFDIIQDIFERLQELIEVLK